MRELLADDHQMMRDGLAAMLKKEGVDVVGGASNGREAVEQAQALRPEIVVMDISMPELNGVDATRQIRASQPSVKVIALSMNADVRYVTAMFGAGASGYLIKSSAADELFRALEAVASGLKYVSPPLAHLLIEGFTDHAPSLPRAPAKKPLSPREREVLQLVAEGNSSKEIARHLGLAVPTVETHRRQIMLKLNLRTIAQLTKYAIREGLTPAD
jgi:two-component system response regulator NreC